MDGDEMSLFGDENYQWRETYFVLFRDSHRPIAKEVAEALTADDGRFQISDVRADEEGRLESLTIKSPDDFAAMDISYVTGEEVAEQIAELTQEFSRTTLDAEEQQKLDSLTECNARFDIFHFEQVASEGGEEDDFLDPAALLIVMERLAQLCQGVSIDPQSGSLM
jgi:hypothetical protein